MTQGNSYDKGIRKDQYTGSYGDFKPRHVKSDGERYPNDIVQYEEQNIDDFVYVKTAESEGPVLHPTQKPIELGRYLIKTYSNPGDVILNNTCGIGSFLLSAILENRKFIGIAKNEPILMEEINRALPAFAKTQKPRHRQGGLFVPIFLPNAQKANAPKRISTSIPNAKIKHQTEWQKA